MRSKVVKTLALALVLSGAGMSLAQTSPSGGRKPPETSGTRGANAPRSGEKSKLEEMLAEALKNNPDIRVAAAKLAEADAELNRMRVQVTQKIVALHASIARQKAEIAYRQKEYERYKALLADRAIDARLVEEVHDKLTLAKAQLEELEVQLPALIGKVQNPTSVEKKTELEWNFEKYVPLIRAEVRMAIVDIPQAEKLRKALQTPVKVDYKNMNFDAILKDLAKKVPGLSFRNLAGAAHSAEKINLRFEEALPVSAILQALADETNCRFYVREYGILAIVKENMPPGAMTVEEFLRQKPAANPTVTLNNDTFSWLPWKTPDKIEGTIKQINPNGYVVISLNSVDGLLDGHTLHLYRPSDEPSKTKYLGTIRIINSSHVFQQKGKERMGQPVGRLTEPPKVGDKVSARMPSK